MTGTGRGPRALLVNAPFGLVTHPPLGVSLIKAASERAGFDCDVLYASFEFAELLGFPAYLSIQRCATPMLLPERPFASALTPGIPPLKDFYDEIVEPFARNVWPFIKNEWHTGESHDTMVKVERLAHEFVDEVAERESLREYDVIAFSSCYGQHLASLAMAKRIKERHPDKLIAFGGANCEGVMGAQLVRSFDFVDYAFSGDGDLSFPMFLEALRDGKEMQVPGMASKADAGDAPCETPRPAMRTDMDTLPYPDFTEYFAAVERFPESRKYQLALSIEGSRGCWWGEKHHCVFCGLNGVTMQFRSKSPERFVEELRFLVEKYGETRVMASDNIMDMRWLKSVIPALQKDRVHDILFFEVKSNLKKEDLEGMADAGITSIQPGIESLNDHILGLMDKGTSTMQNLQLLKWAAEFGILVTWNVLTGFPGERAEDYQEMADVMSLVPHLDAPSGFARISIDRFSPYYYQPEKYDIEVYPAVAYSYIFDLPDDEIENLAYWHYYVCENGTNRFTMSAPDHARPSLRVRAIWEKLHEKVHFRYRVEEDGGVVLEDTRPCSAEEVTRLEPLESAIFRIADQAAGRSRIVKQIQGDPRFTGAEEPEIDAALDFLEERKIVYRDGDRVLALATTADSRERSRPIRESRILTP